MKNYILVILLFTSKGILSQYYYKDIVGAQETSQYIQNLVDANIKSVSINSFMADGSLARDFLINQQITLYPLTLTTSSKTGQNEDARESILVSIFNENNLLIKTIDSNSSMTNTSFYDYNGKGNISKITILNKDSSGRVVMTEEHEWKYSEPGRPEKMFRKKNNVFMDEIVFIYDNSGNIIEEQTMKNGEMTETLYYYYNDKNLLTDIVRFNSKVKKLLPDFLFEYSSDGRVIQKITVPGNSSDYLIWRYQYDSRGLKIKEACYDKNKQLLGRVDYTYSLY